MARIYLLVIIFTCLTAVYGSHYCYWQSIHWYRETVCSSHGWWGICWAHRTVWRYYYSRERYCCHGWKGYRCNTPVCNPGCRNGGTCVSPFTCRCPAGYSGDICAGYQSCSHLRPCYPGTCYGSNSCACSNGFSGSSCLTLTNPDYKAVVQKINSTFTFYAHTKGTEAYSYMADVTNKTVSDVVWTNQAKFNTITMNLEASINIDYTFAHVPPRPRYIRDHKFGIVEAYIDVNHFKLSKGGFDHLTKLPCSGVSSRSPYANKIFECNLRKDDYFIQFDSGDRVSVKYKVTTGGYRELINPDYNSYYRTDVYSGIYTENEMEFRFDYDEPVHCIEDSSCNSNESPLSLNEDITKVPLAPKWSGWIDELSGLQKYVIEVWKMEYSLDYKGLREPEITSTVNPVPLFIEEVNITDPIQFPKYEPKEPGVYSVILEVNDKANNSRYTRRFSIFDKTSQITTSQTHRLYALSALEETDYYWTTTLDHTIQVTWKNHFINQVHEDGHFLAKILDYTPRLSDDIKRYDYKKIQPEFDDIDGHRNKSAIKNINSIVRFETNHGKMRSENPPHGWVEVSPLKENHTFTLTGINIEDGDSHQFWVRAYDIMGNTNVDTTVLHFDSSKPKVYTPDISLNIENGTYPFSSSVTLTAKDDDSGIKKVLFKFKVEETGEIRSEKEFLIKTKTKEYCDTKPKECYCVRMGHCFMLDVTLTIDNCWMKIPIDSKNEDVYIMDVTVYNSAMLSATISQPIGKVSNIKGVEDYFSPTNITVVKTTDTTVSLKWVQAPTCYDRAGIQIKMFQLPDNTSTTFKIHKDATTFDLTGLSPVTAYWIEMTTNYGNDTIFISSTIPTILAFETAEEAAGLSSAGAGGLSAGFLVILAVVVVVLVYLGRTGRLQPAKQQVTAGIRTIRNTIRVRSTPTGNNNRACYTKDDDDIYLYGGMEMKGEKTWLLSRKDISLESELTRGRFAVIYIAKYYNNVEAKTVVAKTLKDDQNEENIVKMRAKINFYASKVGHHKNVLDFIGSVEDDVRGPMMILEYCCKGVLKEFLVAVKENVTVEVEERLFRIVFGICQGMNYLASVKVVHRRLAARNILLNEHYEPKIAGFGPEPEQDQQVEDDDKSSERIPVKWTAPECMKSTKNANELSDVWSYGIVMWEIFSLGETPFPGIRSGEVPARVRKGYKMKKPECCDDKFYEIMLKCWHYDPRKRSGFAQIKDQLTGMFTEAPGDEYYYRTNELQ